jgi:hypothetical protein
LSFQKSIRAIGGGFDQLSGAWGAKKLDESSQPDAQAHSADYELKDVHFLKSGECGPLLEIEHPEQRDQ